MVILLYIVFFLVFLLLGIFLSSEMDFEALGFTCLFIAFFYIGFGLMLYVAPGSDEGSEDFTTTELIEEAKERKCEELILQLREYPRCLKSDRTSVKFTKKKDRLVFWPINKLADGGKYDQLIYRKVTKGDLEVPCESIKNVKDCVQAIDTRIITL